MRLCGLLRFLTEPTRYGSLPRDWPRHCSVDRARRRLALVQHRPRVHGDVGIEEMSDSRFDRLANQHKDAIYRQMVRICGNHEDAEDSLVLALMAAYRSLPSLNNVEAFPAWLAQMGRRACYRLRHRKELIPIFEMAGGYPTPDDLLEQNQMKRCLDDALASLPVGLRTVYIFREVDQLSAHETSERTGLTVPAIKSRLHRARAMMRNLLEKSLCLDESFVAHRATYLV